MSSVWFYEHRQEVNLVRDSLRNVLYSLRTNETLNAGSKNPSRTTSHAKSAPAKYGGRGGAYYGNINPKRAAKMEKSYNMMRRPTDKTLVSRQNTQCVDIL